MNSLKENQDLVADGKASNANEVNYNATMTPQEPNPF